MKTSMLYYKTSWKLNLYTTVHAYLQIQEANGDLRVLQNSVDVTNSINDIGVLDLTPRNVSISRVAENSIRTSFGTGVSIDVSITSGLLSFVTSLSPDFQGSTTGLLGNFNGDSSDDLMYRNGTIIDVDSPDDLIHDFGQSCEYNN